MPSASDRSGGEYKPLPAAPRYLRRNAARAMAGYLVRGLVELLTNSRDSAYRLFAKKLIDERSLAIRPVEIEFMSGPGAKGLVVRDRFEGMTADVMSKRLLQYGQPASEFESGARVRGINARGAKDVGVLGETKFESISEGLYAECLIREGMYREPRWRRATPRDRERLGLSSGNGTVVTLSPFPDVPFPHFDGLVHDLERHVEMRYAPDGLPRVPIVLREVRKKGTGREADIVGFSPQGEQVLDQEIPVPEYSGYGSPARLTLSRSEGRLRVGGNGLPRLWRSEAG